MTISNTAWHLHHYLARLRVLVNFNGVSAPSDAIICFWFWALFFPRTFGKNVQFHLASHSLSLTVGHPSWATIHFSQELPLLPASDGRRQWQSLDKVFSRKEKALEATIFFTKSRWQLLWQCIPVLAEWLSPNPLILVFSETCPTKHQRWTQGISSNLLCHLLPNQHFRVMWVLAYLLKTIMIFHCIKI